MRGGDEPPRALVEFLAAAGARRVDPAHLVAALTHPSYANEKGGGGDYERLEFLGDAVIGLAVGEFFFRRLPAAPEGELARLRAHAVRQGSLAAAARRIGLGQALRLGRGEARAGGADRDSILCSALEAVIGAVFLGDGYAGARRVVEAILRPELERLGDEPVQDPKSLLQERLQEQGWPPPAYVVVQEEGPPHARRFTVEARHGRVVLGRGTGRTKQEAEQEAAREALGRLSAVEANHLDDLAHQGQGGAG